VSATRIARSARHGQGRRTDLRCGGAATGAATGAGGLRKVDHHRGHTYRRGARSLAAVAALLALAGAPVPAQTVSRLNAIARAQADSGFSGVVLVARDTVVMVEKAFSARPGNPISTQSQFNIGSITKGFTAAAILRLRS